MNVKYQSVQPRGSGDWFPDTTDPADIFVILYDSLPSAAAQLRPDLSPNLWRADPEDNRSGRLLGDLLDLWYSDPQVQRCAERVHQLACRGRLARDDAVAVAPPSAAPAVFSILVGLDRALYNVHPGQRGTSMVGLSALGLRYVRTGRLNTDRVAGALLPRRTPFGRSAGSVLGRCFLSVERVDAEIWNGVSHRRLPTQQDIGRRSGTGELRLASVPLVAREDLAVTFSTTPAGNLSGFQLAPRDTAHLRERIRSVLGALDNSGAAIAVLPDYTLSTSLLGYWQELLRISDPPPGTRLKWIVVGGGIADDRTPRRSSAVMLDRDLGDIILTQDKLAPTRLGLHQLTMRSPESAPAVMGSVEPDDSVTREISEDIATGSELHIVDTSIGRVAILSGNLPARLEAATGHVTHLLRAEALSGPLAEPPAQPMGLVLSSGLLIPASHPADPPGGSVVSLPLSAEVADQQGEAIVTVAFDPDEVTVAEVSTAADGRAALPVSRVRSADSRRLHELRGVRLTDPGALLRDGWPEVEELRSRFDLVKDPRELALAAQLSAQLNATRGRVTAAKDAAGGAMRAARQGAAQFVEAQVRALSCQFCRWDDQPLSSAVVDLAAELEWASAWGYAGLELTALCVLAQARSQMGSEGAAAELLDRAAALGDELLFGPDNAELAVLESVATASVMLASGERQEAAAVLDRSELGLARIGAQRLSTPVLALSARVRHQLGDVETAHRLLDDCGEYAPPDDVAMLASQRGVRALLLADKGDHIVAEQLARSAVRVSDWSERLDIAAQARADLAAVLMRANRPAQASLPAAWALGLFERKGDVVAAAAILELVPPGEGSEDWPFLVEAWLTGDDTSLVAGRTTELGVRLLRQASGPLAGGAPAGRPAEVLVTLLAGSAATVSPHGYRREIPRSGYTDTLIFEVTPKEAMPLRLVFMVNLYKEGTLLQEMGVTMVVLPRDSRIPLDEG